MSAIRQNFHTDCEAAINKLINYKLHVSYVYQSMAWYFDRDDVALPGFHKFFKHLSCEKRKFAMMLMKCQNLRGGRIIYQDIKNPEKEKWGNGLECMQLAFSLEKKVNEQLLEMHQLASNHHDPILCNMLEEDYLQKEVHVIRHLGHFVTQLQRVGQGLGEFTFDHEVLQEFESHPGQNNQGQQQDQGNQNTQNN